MPWNGSSSFALTPVSAFTNVTELVPSGDTTGATDRALINSVLGNGIPLQLIPGGIYYTDQPITLPIGAVITTPGATQGSPFDWPGVPLVGSARIAVGSAFAGGGTGTGILQMLSTTANTMRGGQVLRGLLVDGTGAPSGTNGIYAKGNVFAPVIRDCMVYNCPNVGVFNETGGIAGNGPDDWAVSGLKVSHCKLGVVTTAPDSWWTDCEASECTNTNWTIVAGGNSRYIGCKAENSAGGYGWDIQTGNTGGQFFHGCDSQINFLSGFHVSGVANTQGNGFVIFNGCTSTADAAVQGLVHGGFYVDGCRARVMLNGCAAILTNGGAYPPYGLHYANTSFKCVDTACFLQGNLAATLDDGTNTNALVSNLLIT